MRKVLITCLFISLFALLGYGAEPPAPLKEKSKTETTLRKINNNLKEELSLCDQMNLVQGKSLKLSHARFDNSAKKSKKIGEQLSYCQEALAASKKLTENRERENESLRRKVAGNTNLLSLAVIASAGVAVLLLLL